MKSLTHSDSMRFCRRGRLFRYSIKKRSSQADEYPINGCRHQKIAEMARSHGSLVLELSGGGQWTQSWSRSCDNYIHFVGLLNPLSSKGLIITLDLKTSF